ncbi:MAG: polyprenyl synthetase family protein [Saprospiraceae bacterium]|nr:polyprenyl synthetase family protein [Saprospiraceae bacterium]MDW8228991.1 polyprenyl synthetase family protein [Saprospiraceae bacterium]
MIKKTLLISSSPISAPRAALDNGANTYAHHVHALPIAFAEPPANLRLEDIKQPILTELATFEKRFRDSMRSDVPLLDRITWYIVRSKGKQVRPMLVLLSARLFGAINEASYTAAALVELLHTATLVHDDVVDDAHQRRGFFSINALWKNKIAVLVGDFLLSKGLLLSIQQQQFQLLEIVSRAVKEMAEGELLQMEKARRLDIEEDIYYDIIRQKTASLIAAACSAGAASTTADADMIERLRLFGEKMGMAFQIRDDLFDFGEDVDIGKPTGIDIKEKKMTLPLIYALHTADRSVRRRIINIVRNESEKAEKVAEVIQFVRQSGGLAYAQEAMRRFRREALEILHGTPDNDARTALRDLLFFATERNR